MNLSGDRGEDKDPEINSKTSSRIIKLSWRAKDILYMHSSALIQLKCDMKNPQIWTMKEFVGSDITPHLPHMDQTPLMLQVLLIDCKQIHSCHTPSCYVLTCGGRQKMVLFIFNIQIPFCASVHARVLSDCSPPIAAWSTADYRLWHFPIVHSAAAGNNWISGA